jgi:hypothetical protein
VVAQFATGTPDLESATRIQVAEPTATYSVAPVFASAAAELPASPARRFHGMLRRREAEMARAAQGLPRAARAPRVVQPPPVGDQRTFKVCRNLDCPLPLANVPATARYVGTRAAIYVDDSVQAGGFTQQDLDAMGAQFDTVLHAIAVNAFGPESDIDANSVVIVLLTRKVNQLVLKPDCNTAFVTGYFFGADLAPGLAPQYNNGEVFYGFVPDSGGPTTCAYTVDRVRNQLPTTFIHEFQHMISFNHHVLIRGGATEVLWLNEGLSHFAEELAGLHYDSLGQNVTATRFLILNFYNAFTYLRNPAPTVVVTDEPPGGLPSRGAELLLVRYLADRFGMTAIRNLVQTSRVGASNVAAVTGLTFPTIVGRWALANYEPPGVAVPAELRYNAYSLRVLFEDLNASDPLNFDRPFPLLPITGNSQTGLTVTSTVTSGSGTYLLITQPPVSPPFDVTFRTSGGGALPSAAIAQLAVLRLQ